MEGDRYVEADPYFETQPLLPAAIVLEGLAVISHNAVNEQITKANKRLAAGDFAGAIASSYTLTEHLLKLIMAFWLSSPLIDPSTVVITAAALGWEFAVGKAIAAVALGLFGGFGVRLLVWHCAFAAPLREDAGGGCGGCGSAVETGKPVWRFWREAPRMKTFRSEAVTNARFLVKWLALAYLLEALLITYVPADLIAGVVGGDGFAPIVMGALVGAPAYLNGYAAPPLVAGLMEQGMSPGAAMAFMVAGSVNSIPAMVAVWSLVRRQVFAAYVGFGIAGAILSGALFAALVA